VKRTLGAALVAALVLFAQAPNAFGSPGPGQPPPPPPTPSKCGPCGGPPPPPTPIPTAPPKIVPTPAPVVSAHLSPIRVARGHSAKLSVVAIPGADVVSVVQYHKGKPVTYRGTVGSDGVYTRSLKVPKNAPLGKANVQVTVKGMQQPYSAAFTLTVTK
jgi:hypothetical protein